METGEDGFARVPSARHSCAATAIPLLRVVDDDVTAGGREYRGQHRTRGGWGPHQRLRVEGVRGGATTARLSEILHADDQGLHAWESLTSALDEPGGCGQVPDDIEAADPGTELDVLGGRGDPDPHLALCVFAERTTLGIDVELNVCRLSGP